MAETEGAGEDCGLRPVTGTSAESEKENISIMERD